MEFSLPERRRQSEPALPMINVVFLLLIFFLMSAQIVTPPPFEVTPPTARSSGAPQEDVVLHISADGAVALADAGGPDVWQALTAIPAKDRSALLIRADAALPAAELAGILSRLAGIGFAQIQLATVPR